MTDAGESGRGELAAAPIMTAVLVSLLLYTFFFYQVDPVRQAPLGSLLESTYRRGLVAFVPLMWLAFLLSPMGAWLRRVTGAVFAPPPARPGASR